MRPALFTLALLPTALASPFLLNDKPLSSRALQITESLVSDLTFFSQYSAATYCNSAAKPNTPIACASSACPAVVANNASVITSFEGHQTGLGGFVALDHVRGAIVVAFKGSSSVRNWLANALFGLSPCTNISKSCQAHTGFQAAWTEVSPTVLAALKTARAANPTYSVISTGHSLGGAVANYFAATYRASDKVSVTVYSYGSPRVGNSDYTTAVDAQTKSGTLGAEYRITHVADPVPRLPPLLFGYRHTSPELWLSVDAEDLAEYPLDTIKVCEGALNLSCNGGTLDFDVDAHGFYLGDMSACGGDFTWKRDEEDDIIKQRLQHWQEMDRLYVEALGE